MVAVGTCRNTVRKRNNSTKKSNCSLVRETWMGFGENQEHVERATEQKISQNGKSFGGRIESIYPMAGGESQTIPLFQENQIWLRRDGWNVSVPTNSKQAH